MGQRCSCCTASCTSDKCNVASYVFFQLHGRIKRKVNTFGLIFQEHILCIGTWNTAPSAQLYLPAVSGDANQIFASDISMIYFHICKSTYPLDLYRHLKSIYISKKQTTVLSGHNKRKCLSGSLSRFAVRVVISNDVRFLPCKVTINVFNFP